MASVTYNIAPRISNTTELNAYFGAFSAALVTVGCTRVDGTVTWGAVTWVNTAGTSYGYEVFKLPSGQPGSSEIYFKCGYSASTTSPLVPSVTITQGTGWSSGTSSLTGPGATGGAVLVSGSTADSTLRTTIVSCDGDGLVVALNYTASLSSMRTVLLLDRMRNPADGSSTPPADVPTPTGYCRYVATGSGSSALINVDCAAASGAGAVSAITRWPAVVGPGVISASTSTLTTVAPIGVLPVAPLWISTINGTLPSKLAVVYSSFDVPVGTDLIVPHLGANRHFTTLGNLFPFMDHNAASQGAALAIWTSD